MMTSFRDKCSAASSGFARAAKLILLPSLLAVAASAATIYTPVQTVASGYRDTNGLTSSLNIGQFDGSLGTLTEVIITLAGDARGAYSYTNLATSAQSFTFQANVTVTLGSPVGGSPLAVTIPQLSDSQRTVGASGSGTATYSTPSFPTLTLSGANSVGPTTFTNPSILAAFTGNSVVALPLMGKITWDWNGTGNASTTVLSDYQGTVTVQYGYVVGDETPEPSTYAFMLGGFGLLGAGLIRRRKA